MAKTLRDVDTELGKYYKEASEELGKFFYVDGDDKSGRFEKYSDDNGFEFDDFADEMKGDAEDSQFIEFATDDYIYPGIAERDEADKKQIIFNALQTIYEEGSMREGPRQLPSAKDLFPLAMDQNDEKALIDRVTEDYSRRCPEIVNDAPDKALYTLLAVQRKHKFDYLQFMVSAFMRWCVETQKKNDDSKKDTKLKITVADWKNQCLHFQQLKPKDSAIVEAGVTSFVYRTVPRLLFDQPVLIQDHLEATVQYITGAAQWVKNMSTKQGTCPFQFDVVIGYPKVRRIKDDEEEEEDDNEKAYKQSHEFFGDVAQGLKSHGIKYGEFHCTSSEEMQGIRKVYEVLQGQKGDSGSLRGKRFCMFIDRGTRLSDPEYVKTENDDRDKVIMFQSPEKIAKNGKGNVGIIPNDALPEWGLNALKVCVIPRKDRNEEEKKGDDDMDMEEHQHMIGPIHAQTVIPHYVNAQMIVVSFQVPVKDSIRCWMMVNGQATRFEAEDIIDTLPRFFDCEKTATENGTMDWTNNADYSASQEIKEQQEVIRKLLIDEQYANFRRTFIGK